MYIDVQELSQASLERKGHMLVVEGTGHVQGLKLRGLEWDTVSIRARPKGMSGYLPGKLRRHLRIGSGLTFEDCDFSGLKGYLDPGPARFVRCRFEDVQVKPLIGSTSAHFINCVFSGSWEGAFSATPDWSETGDRVEFEGNDFRGLTGMEFRDGISLDANRFDEGRKHVIVRRHGKGWRELRELALSDPFLRSMVALIDDGQAQDWLLLERYMMQEEEWATMLAAVYGSTET